MDYKKKIYAHVDKIAAFYEISDFWQYVKTFNPANDKPYHNLWHTACVVKSCNDIAVNERLPVLLRMPLVLAAMFHDFGHHSKDDSRNVNLAKEMFKGAVTVLRPNFETDDFIADVQLALEIIDCTKYPYEIATADLSMTGKIIRDADLLQWTHPTMIEHNFIGLSAEMEIPLDEFIPKNKEFITNITFATKYAQREAAAVLREKLNEIDLFQKRVNVGKHKRIVIVARAASGKDFLRNKFIEKGFKPSISYTTRPPRPGEVYGKDYVFISEEQGEQMIANDEFYEYVKFNDWLYATDKKSFMTDDIFIMTPVGVSKIKSHHRSSCFIIYLDVPAEVRRDRLLKRSMPGDTVERRLAADEADFKDFTDYDMRVTNPDF